MISSEFKFAGIIVIVTALIFSLGGCDFAGDDEKEIEPEPWEEGRPESHEGLQQALRDEGLENEEGIIVLELGGNLNGESLEAKRDFEIDGDDQYSIDLEDSFAIGEQIEASFKNVDMGDTDIEIHDLKNDTLALANSSVNKISIHSGLEERVSIIVDGDSKVKEQIVANSSIGLYDPDKEIEVTGDRGDDVVYLHELEIEIEGRGDVEVAPEEENHKYEAGTEVKLEAIPDEGWKLEEWSGDKELTEEKITVTMEEDISLTACFINEETDKYDMQIEVIEEKTSEVIEGAQVKVENYRGEKREAVYDEELEAYTVEEIKLEDGDEINIDVTKEGYNIKSVAIGLEKEDGEIFAAVEAEKEKEDDRERPAYPELEEGVNLIYERPEQGFEWPYYVYIPEGYFEGSPDIDKILLEQNNSGRSSDAYYIHKGAARDNIDSYDDRYAEALGVPFLTSTFPRPADVENHGHDFWRATYTHALDRKSLELNEDAHTELREEEMASIYRVDKQLINMADHLIETLDRNHDIELSDEFFVWGNSASGNAANRFTALHPERTAAAAAGALNGTPVLPVDTRESPVDGTDDEYDLTYPVGMYDTGDLADIEKNLSEIQETPQYLFMGSEDDNDTLPYDDAFDDHERELIKDFYDTVSVNDPRDPDSPGDPQIIVDRFEVGYEIYEKQNVSAQFVVYEGEGHGKSHAIDDVVDFFENHEDYIGETEFEWK